VLRLYSLKTEIDRLLLLSVLFGTLLLAAKVVYTGSGRFISLEWNLFLAYIPYFISQWLSDRPFIYTNKWMFAVTFTAWLLFIPNSFYILTDLFHLVESSTTPMWFDLLLILTFAWNGLVMGVLSVRQMEKIFQFFWGRKHELLFLYPVMLLNALGIYIGRYLRFNSWDIITNPFTLLVESFELITHPIGYKNVWAMVFSYSIFMTLIYLMMKKISKRI
jgi:uncharacterized membrane protein